MWCLTLWRPAAFRDFQEKNTETHTHVFAWEFLRSSQRYKPGKKLKRRGKSSSLNSKKKFLLGLCRYFMRDVISGGLSGHLGPLYLALGANR